METDLHIDPELLVRARRAYERGRLLSGLVRAAGLSAIAGLVARLGLELDVLPWLPLSFLLWLSVYYKGGALLDGARYGLLAGVLTWLLPLSILRPCCRHGMGAGLETPCTMPSMCVLAGAVLGLGLVATMPRMRAGKRALTSLGMVLGVLSLAALKCSALFAGEALGLLGGLSAGILGLAAFEALLERRRAAH
ncbi:MAG: hypothetical protein QM778_31960 [Myxococcales bacterium]